MRVMDSQIKIQSREALGTTLRARRKKLGLTQEQIAKRIGISRRSYNELEQGERNATFDMVLHAVQLLGLDFYIHSRGPVSTGEK
jgi:HTH-type transcriptional regulator/antitoxin HipB